MKKSIITLLLLPWVQSLSAQTLEPKLYANTLVGANVLFLGYGSSGINTRYGTDFDGLGLLWQYMWAD